MELDLISALGGAWGEPEVQKLVEAFGIDGEPVVQPGAYTGNLHNRSLGVELTFRQADALDVRLRDYPAGALVLSNIRMHGAKSSRITFESDLPFGVRFGDSKKDLIAKFGLPDADDDNNEEEFASIRWDTARYALFARLDDFRKLDRFSIQLPVAASNKPGFEKR